MGFICRMLSDEKGQPSTQRVCMMLLVVSVVVWISCAGYKAQKLPDIPTALNEFIQWLFSALVFGVAASKGATAYVQGKAAPSSEPGATSCPPQQ
jgi:hypothetical protein